MLSSFWSGIGPKLADQWVARLLTPAMLFWAVGALAWCWTERPATARGQDFFADFADALQARADVIAERSGAGQIALIVAALAVVAGSAVLAERLTAPFLRVLEGYWPGGRPRWLWNALVGRARARRRALRDRWGELRKLEQPTAQQRSHEGALAARLHAVPPEDLLMPTALGNVLRAAELRPSRRYGLDAVVTWPRLWLLLPETSREEVSASRARLDGAGRGVLWLLATAAWGGLVWWIAPVAIAAALAVHRGGVLPAAQVYGDLVEATYDLHRTTLYDALRLPRPAGPASEPEAGRALTAYLWEGYAPDDLRFARDGPA
jgi:hypothetical protein